MKRKPNDKAVAAVDSCLETLASMAREGEKDSFTREEMIEILERARQLLCVEDTSWAVGI